MREDIVSKIGKMKDVTHAFILTFNLDFIFIQSVVLPALKRIGNPVLTIFADATCVQSTFQSQKYAISGLGSRYRVVPVAMGNLMARFHPKAIFLSGNSSAKLFVGSGNLSFGGWRQNAEIWNEYSTETDGTAAFSAFKEYLLEVNATVPNSEALTSMIEDAYAEESKPWAREMEVSSGLLGVCRSSVSLMNQMKSFVPKNCRKLTFHSPYFDDNGKMAALLCSEFTPENVELLVQPKHSQFTQTILKNISPYSPKISLVTQEIPRSGEDQTAFTQFIHAKWYAFETDEAVILFSGSANCSLAAMNPPTANHSNAELLAVRTLSIEQFEELILSAYTITDEPYEFPEQGELQDETDHSSAASCVITQASFESGLLRISYSSNTLFNESYCITGVKVGTTEFDIVPDSCSLTLPVACSESDTVAIMYRSEDNDTTLYGAEHWIDFEELLSIPHPLRALNNLLTSPAMKSLDSETWTELIKLFGERMRYDGFAERGGSSIGNSPQLNEQGERIFTAESMQSGDYFTAFTRGGYSGMSGFSLVGLLRQYLGIDEDIPEYEDVEERLSEESSDESFDLESEHSGRSVSPAKNQKGAADSAIVAFDLKKNRKQLELILAAFENRELVERKPLKIIVEDLKFISVLLRASVMHDSSFLEQNRRIVLECTYRIWNALFSPVEGSLLPKLIAEDETLSEEVLAGLNAVLIGWFNLIDNKDSAEFKRLKFSTIIMQAYWPKLFYGSSVDAIGCELHKSLRAVRDNAIQAETMAELFAIWQEIVTMGAVWSKIVASLTDIPPKDLRQSVTASKVKRGEFLWMGNNRVVVVEKEYDRTYSGNVAQVIALTENRVYKSIKVSYTIPLLNLIENEVIELTDYELEQFKISMNN